MIRRIKWPKDKTTKGCCAPCINIKVSLWLLMTCWLSKITVKLAILLRNAVPRQTVIAFPVSLEVAVSVCDCMRLFMSFSCLASRLKRLYWHGEIKWYILHCTLLKYVWGDKLSCFPLWFYHHRENSFTQTSQTDFTSLASFKPDILVPLTVYKTYGTYKLLQLMGNTTFENGWLDPGPLMAQNEGTSSLPPRPVRSKRGLDTCHYLGLGRIQRLAEVWNPIKNCHFTLSSCHTFETHILLENQSQEPELAGDWPSDIQTLTVSHEHLFPTLLEGNKGLSGDLKASVQHDLS